MQHNALYYLSDQINIVKDAKLFYNLSTFGIFLARVGPIFTKKRIKPIAYIKPICNNSVINQES